MKFILLSAVLCFCSISLAETDQTNHIAQNTSASLNKQGKIHFESGAYEEAIESFTEAIKKTECLPYCSSRSIYYFNRGLAHATINRHEEAIKDFDESIKIDSVFDSAYNSRGASYGNLERHDEVMADFTLAIKLNPNYALAYGNRGIVHHELGNYEQAEKDLTTAHRLDEANFTEGFRHFLSLSKQKAKEKRKTAGNTFFRRCAFFWTKK